MSYLEKTFLFSEEQQKDFLDCALRFYTLSEIINSVITVGFQLSKFDEHPSWKNKTIPGEFTIVAVK